MNPSSPYNQARTRTLRLAYCAALLLSAAACLPASGPSLTNAAAHYQPVRIAAAIAARPGAVAWSPDSSQLAVIDRTVTIIDADGDGAALRRIDIPAPRYLAWADDGMLYALSREGDYDVLYLIDTARPGTTRTVLDRRADAVYPLDGRRSFLLSQQASQLRIGTEVRCALSLHDLASGTTTTLHAYSRIVPAANIEEDLLFAWRHAGPNPLDGSFLIMELIKPPALPPYTLVRAFDPVSGDLVEIGSQDRRTVSVSASWSPDGRKLALTDRDGRLAVRGPGGNVPFDGPALGRYPSWHPADDLLIVGGTVINPATGERTLLLVNGEDSYARWSPDGARLALIAQGGLLLLRNFAAPAPAPLDRDQKKKLFMLQELLRDGLITKEDYRARKSRLLQDKEGGAR